jgi:hypothetical protein
LFLCCVSHLVNLSKITLFFECCIKRFPCQHIICLISFFILFWTCSLFMMIYLIASAHPANHMQASACYCWHSLKWPDPTITFPLLTLSEGPVLSEFSDNFGSPNPLPESDKNSPDEETPENALIKVHIATQCNDDSDSNSHSKMHIFYLIIK